HTMDARDALRGHWPEYLIEGWALGMFMVAAGAFATLFEYPNSPLHHAIDDANVRRVLTGIAMGLTGAALIYSPWGKRSGAHINPGVRWTFWRLGKVARWDAVFYIVAQFAGSTLGVLVSMTLLQAAFTMPPVHYAVTLPGSSGPTWAFVAEFVISA